MKHTVPIFIIGSGRSGTLQMAKMLENIEGVQAHHEYLFENILKPSVLHRMGLIKSEGIKDILLETHVPAVHYSDEPVWVDSSNALPWIIRPLYELFPNARFIHLLRDGRKVVSSFYHKFSEIMYSDECVYKLNKWIANPELLLSPPPEKKYWRPIPVKGEKYFEEFTKFNRFQRLCYYWQDCNIRIYESLSVVPDNQKASFHLEDLVSDSTVLECFLNIFGAKYDDSYLLKLKRPVNVHVPQNFPLTENERVEFNSIAGHAMNMFGYSSLEEYHVVY